MEKANPIADSRLFKNMYICRDCKAKMRVSNQKLIRKGKVKCRRCGSTALRPKHRELRKLKA